MQEEMPGDCVLIVIITEMLCNHCGYIIRGGDCCRASLCDDLPSAITFDCFLFEKEKSSWRNGSIGIQVKAISLTAALMSKPN